MGQLHYTIQTYRLYRMQAFYRNTGSTGVCIVHANHDDCCRWRSHFVPKFVLTLLTYFRVLPDSQSHLGLHVNGTTMQILVYTV